jgi:hypothetical protein
LFCLLLLLNLLNIPHVYRQQQIAPTAGWMDIEDPDTLRPLLREAGITPHQFALYTLLTEYLFVFLGLGAALLIFVNRASDRGALVISMLLMMQTLSADVTRFTFIDEVLGTPVFSELIAVLGAASFIMYFLFPDGRFVPGWTRWVALAFVVIFVVEGFTSLEFNNASWWVIPLGLVGIGMAIYAQAYRYGRVSGPVERRQTRWAMLGLVMTPTAWLLSFFVLVLFPAAQQTSSEGLRIGMLWLFITLPLYAMGPVGITIALLKYRLYDIDIVIRRTLIYSTLTVLLAMVYFGGVALMQSGFVAITGQESPLAIVISTLAIAALFTPVRRRVQDVVDRRFFRRKYDAEKTVDAFARAVRDEVDVDRLRGTLLGVVEETMQPEYVSLWLRPAPLVHRSHES